MSRNKRCQADLNQALQDPLEVQMYLNATLEDGNPDLFLVALRVFHLVVEQQTIPS